MTLLRVHGLPVDGLRGEVVAALFFEDDRPLCGHAALLDWRLNGLLTDMVLRGDAVGRAGEKILVRSNEKLETEWALFAGGGIRGGLGPDTYRILVTQLLETCRRAGFSRIVLGLSPIEEMGKKQLEQLVAGLMAQGAVTGMECELSLA